MLLSMGKPYIWIQGNPRGSQEIRGTPGCGCVSRGWMAWIPERVPRRHWAIPSDHGYRERKAMDIHGLPMPREEAYVPAPHETSIAPEVQLIRQRRLQGVPAMSPDRAAKLAEQLTGSGFNGSTWRKIENGVNRASDDKVAIMSLIVDVKPEELRALGRHEAADRLIRLAGRVMTPSHGGDDRRGPVSVVERQVAADIAEATELLLRLPSEVRDNLLAMLRSMDAAARVRRNEEVHGPGED